MKAMMEQLRQRLVEAGVDTDDVAMSTITIRAKHDAVGDLEIRYRGGEYTVAIGPHHHLHFEGRTDAEVMDDVVVFVSEFVADRIVLTIGFLGREVVSTRLDHVEGRPLSVMIHSRGDPGSRAAASSFSVEQHESRKSYSWSGPVRLSRASPSDEDTAMAKIMEVISTMSLEEATELAKALEQEFGAEDRED